MRIFAAGIVTESNTFCPIPTSLDDFCIVRAGDAVQSSAKQAVFDLAALWGEQARKRADEFVLGMMAYAQPSGITTRSTYEWLRDQLLAELSRASPVDIVLLMLHGAMAAYGYDDCEADLIGRVRAIVGPKTVIGVELDLHCHLSDSKIAAADIVVTYKEYPHVDINDRAQEVFDLAVATKSGAIRPTMALFDCQMVGIYPTSRPPLRGFVDSLKRIEKRPGVLSVSFGHGFPFADLPHVGAKMLVITDNDRALAHELARDLGKQVYALREQIAFSSLSLPLEDALSKALDSAKATVVVADQSDNPGGGAPGDATYALHWLLKHKARDVAMAIFYDPEVVRIAKKAGQNAVNSVRLGGKLSRFSGSPVDIDVTVIALRDNYTHPWPQRSGEPLLNPLGDVASLRHGGIDLIVSSARCQCFTPSIFTDLGIDPVSKRLLVVKSTQHFQAAFAPLDPEPIYMAGPGAVSPNPERIPYMRLNTRRLYPWVPDPLEN